MLTRERGLFSKRTEMIFLNRRLAFELVRCPANTLDQMPL